MRTILSQFDDAVDSMANALTGAMMNRASIAADKLRQLQAEIHSCAKDERMAAVNTPIEVEPAGSDEAIDRAEAESDGLA